MCVRVQCYACSIHRLLSLLFGRGVQCSDNLVDLGSVVPVVAKSKHLMVTVTKELIFRPWCLCECIRFCILRSNAPDSPSTICLHHR